jgi:hypothetical protein
MPISLTPFKYPDTCSGCYWAIDDEDALAEHIARIALGQARHVERIIAAAGGSPGKPSIGAKRSAIDLLTVASGSEPWHRDGWMFQAMSWIAARCADPEVHIRAPHMILAHKGFDGLSVKLDKTKKKVLAAVVFEDKATDNPRATIRSDVWPEFAALESGDRENVLTAELVSVLSSIQGCDVDAAIKKILWSKDRHYRVSITAGESHQDDEGRRRLFNGYEDVVTGPLARRRGETVYVPNLRAWMSGLADKAIDLVRRM